MQEDHVPAVTVRLPAILTSPAPALELECEAATVSEALRAAAARMPELAARMFYGERLLVSVMRNGDPLPPSTALVTELEPGDRLDLVPPIVGG